jgi:YVTN family beta-propeller protein
MIPFRHNDLSPSLNPQRDKHPMKRRIVVFSVALLATACLPLLGEDKPQFPGPKAGSFLLPNGWTISPAGDQVALTDLPLNIIPLADNKHALVATSGFNAHELSLVNLHDKKIVSKSTVRQSWFGLAHDASTGKVLWSAGGAGNIHAFDIKDGALTQITKEAEPVLSRKATAAEKAARKAERPAADFGSGIALSRDGKTLYSLDIDAGTLSERDANELSKKPSRVTKVGARPYDVALSQNGKLLFVSDWIGRSVLVVDLADFRVINKIGVGEHPNQIVVHPKDSRVFVANASSNTVSVIDSARSHVTETIATPLFPLSPEGSTPDALAISPDGKTLYVANADNNCIAVVDIATPSKSAVKGFIPTGWYPTSVAVTPDGKNLLVGVGKGNQTKPNPIEASKEKEAEAKTAQTKRRLPYPYIGTTLSGALSIVAIPDDKGLAAYTETVYKNCPYSDKLLTDAPSQVKTAIPNKVGETSPIKHVIYVIKENRTYDQVFGDIPRGNGDPSLVMFGEQVTPNHHKLANEYVLLDNLYCNGHVSADGHPWSTMAYNTDYLARNWALTYSGREGVEMDDDGDLAKAPTGYLWDACARAGLSYRSYGEYGRRVSQPDGTFKMEGAVPGLVGHFSPDFGISKIGNKRARDPENVDTFLKEFAEYEAKGTLPNFMVVSLGEDHTTGTSPGTFTPQACVASNDLAIGRLVEAVTKSKSWPKTAIFMIEDDAQNGPDHVDAHRTIGLVISPYTKRGHLDSTQYSTVSMIRTMELLLGLAPLSQFDAAATPMFNSFTDKADLTTYTHLPARIDLNSTNTALAYGAQRSSKMDFSEYDKINDFELNEILWRAIKGENAPLPPAVRRAIAYRPLPLRR